MSNLADILIKDFPKKINLEDGTPITLRPLLKDDGQAFLAYFQSLAPEERVELKEEVTDPEGHGKLDGKPGLRHRSAPDCPS